MIISIHQPAYNPWLGYFEKINSSDLFVYLDNVQFQKGSFQNRNKVLTPDGIKWLTVPVKTAGILYKSKIKDIEIDYSKKWQNQHFSILKSSYHKSNHYKKYIMYFEKIYFQKWKYLSDLCWEMLTTFLKILNITTKVVKASSLKNIIGEKSDLILNICKMFNSNVYISGSEGKNYLREKDFIFNDIKVKYQNFNPLPYKQISNDFIPSLGIYDFIFNVDRPNESFQKITTKY